jgi:hypothetical protein
MSTKKLLELVRARRAKLRSHQGIKYTVEDRLWALQQLAMRRSPEVAAVKATLSLAGAGDRVLRGKSELPAQAESAARPISTGRPKANVQLNVSTAAK